MITPNHVFRARARKQLGGKLFGNAWLNALLACLVTSILISLGSVIVIGPFLLEGIVMIGLAAIFLPVVRGQKQTYDLDKIFDGAKQDVAGCIILGLLKNIFIVLWSFLFIIPGIVKTYSYSMAYYIKYDHPEYDWQTCITKSRQMMNGHKWRLFCLHFSFIGWSFVGMVACCGVGLLWVTPYMKMAEANFYDDLKTRFEPVEAPAFEEAAPAEESAQDAPADQNETQE